MAGFAITLACSHPAAPALTREAFIAFDNLTGDPTLDWIAQAAPRMLEHDLTGVPKIVPFAASTIRDAYLEHASRLVHGYYEMRAGKLHFEISVEDAADHRTLGTSAEDGPPGEAMNRAAKNLAAGAYAFSAPEAAAALWGHGDFEGAVALDPGFALAWLGWVQELSATGDHARALEVAQRAMGQPGLDSPGMDSPDLGSRIDKARLGLASAALRQDDGARVAASRQLTELIPYDPALLTSLAELDMAARNFAAAAHDYQLVLAADPANTSVLNQLGYAQALAGDLDDARKAFQEYGRGPGQDAVNALDSLGEALFLEGKFDQAEREFVEAYKKDPSFLQGETLWKAAHAHWLADTAQLAAADQIAEQYFQDRERAHDPLVAWRRATWLYQTGRRQQAVDLLMHAPETPPAAAAFAKRQLEVWNNPQPFTADLAKLELAYRQADPINDGLLRTLYAEALLHAGRKEEARKLLQYWPLPMRDDSPLAALLYPKFLGLRKDLN